MSHMYKRHVYIQDICNIYMCVCITCNIYKKYEYIYIKDVTYILTYLLLNVIL